jgi:hypothetical protein
MVKIRIIKCSNPDFWYANKIGEILEVEKFIVDNGSVRYEYNGKDNYGKYINGLFHSQDIIEVEDK